jgi:hypothetical protein
MSDRDELETRRQARRAFMRLRAQFVYAGMVVVGLYLIATETFADGADWQHQLAGPLLLVAGVLLFWYGLDQK